MIVPCPLNEWILHPKPDLIEARKRQAKRAKATEMFSGDAVRARLAYIKRGTKMVVSINHFLPLKRFQRARCLRLLLGIFSDDALAYLFGGHAAPVHFISLQGFADADGAL